MGRAYVEKWCVLSGERRVCLCAAGSSLGGVGVGVYRFLGCG